ncbi:MAG: SGNH/GDSL hydrolase family protein [Nitrospinales bacterium]
MPLKYYKRLDSLGSSLYKFANSKKARIVFMGGSITAMNGWRDLVGEYFTSKYPNTQFDFINAGFSGTNSTFGAVRFKEHVLKNGKVDLLFLEFAVNDESGYPSIDNRYERGLEGVIRQAYQSNPEIEILLMYFADGVKYDNYEKGLDDPTVLGHEKIAAYYNITSLDLSRIVYDQIKAGNFTWDMFSPDKCHPAAYGHAIYAEYITALLDKAIVNERLAKRLPRPLDNYNYEKAHYESIEKAKNLKGFKLIKEWTAEANNAGPSYVLAAEAIGDEFEFEFVGKAVGLYVIIGKDTGMFDYQIDDGKWQRVNLYDQWCKDYHRPRLKMLAEELSSEKHKIKVKIASDRDNRSLGHALRIKQFVVIGQ